MSTLLATRLAAKLLAHFNKPSKVQNLPSKPIREREIDALQYLSGYVIHALARKVYKSSDYRSTQSQNLLTLLYAVKSENTSAQRLIASQTQGGLWSVRHECLQVFKLVEEKFRKITSGGHVTKMMPKRSRKVLFSELTWSAHLKQWFMDIQVACQKKSESACWRK